jgi:outer membrane protein assembly factor BamB
MRTYADLQKAIKTNVFVTKEQARIIGPDELHSLDWLFDFRALFLQPQWLNRYAEIFWERFADRYPFQVCGMETAAISLVAAIVMKGIERGTPVNGIYIRKSRKRQGLLKQVEGTLTNEPVIIVDDLINSGSTFNKQIKVLSDEGVRTSVVFAILAFRSQDAYSSLNVPVETLFTLNDFDLPLLTNSGTENTFNTFDVKWRFEAPDPSYNIVYQKSSPVLHGGNIYFGTDAGDFVCLDQTTGSPLWHFHTGRDIRGRGVASTPAITDGNIFFGSYDGNVYALDAATGAQQWVYDDADWVGSSPFIARELGLLFIGLEFGLIHKRGGIVALDIKTGKKVWGDRTADYTYCSPLYIREENMVVIGSNDSVVYAYQADTGALRWYYETQGPVKASFAYDATRGLVIFGSADGTLYALTARTGEPVFGRETGAGIHTTPFVKDDTVYFTSLDKRIYAIDIDTWRERWFFTTGGRIFASPIIVGGSLWCGSNDGKLYELDPKNGALKSFFQTSERVVNKIAYDEKNETLFVPTVANELYCLKRANDKIAVPRDVTE